MYTRAGGFTLLDVLVSIAVVVILISIMLPSLGRVRETAHQVICRSNVRQIGIGIALYADDNMDRLINSVHVSDGPGNKPWDTTYLRLPPSQSGTVVGAWDGLGRLYELEYLPAPKLYYCPSHHGRNGFRDYENEWGARSIGAISGNYQYRGRGPKGPIVAHHPNQPTTMFLSEVNPMSAIVADSMRTQADFNHQVGANILRANNSVDWFGDAQGRLITQLPREGEVPQVFQFENFWRNLDDSR